MDDRLLESRLAGLAGFATWLVVGIPPLLEIFSGDFRPTASWYAWLGSYVAFGALFLLLSQEWLEALPLRSHRALLLVQTLLAGVAVATLPNYGFVAILFILTAAQAAHVLPFRSAALWVLGQTLFTGVVAITYYPEVWIAGVQTVAYLGFQLFALLTTSSALQEATARRELARTNAELLATRELLAQSSRLAERTRIARDLHDVLGHHLTALSLNLEVATHLTDGRAREHVQGAHAVAKLLLADVREAVSSMRDGDLDLEKALRALVRDVPGLAVHLRIADDLGVEDVARAQALVRCVQEIVTNALRHAHARNLWIDLERTEDGVVVRARDDGRGSQGVRPGNGLAGMRERFEALGGRVDVRAGAGAGFALDAWLPARPQGAA